jgi:hypothetical protein
VHLVGLQIAQLCCQKEEEEAAAAAAQLWVWLEKVHFAASEYCFASLIAYIKTMHYIAQP